MDKEYFSEKDVADLNRRAQKACKTLEFPYLGKELKQRIISTAPAYQFGFTGFKGNPECFTCGKTISEYSHFDCDGIVDHVIKTRLPIKYGLVGQFLVAISVPEKEGTWAYWYINVPSGLPMPYRKGEPFYISERLFDIPESDLQVFEMLQESVFRLCNAIDAAY